MAVDDQGNVILPRAIKAKVDAGAELHTQFVEASDPTKAVQPARSRNPPNRPKAQNLPPVVATHPTEEPYKIEVTPAVTSDDQPASADPPAQTPAVQGDPAAEIARLQAALRTLQGKYSAEVPGAAARIRELNAALDEQRARNNDLATQLLAQRQVAENKPLTTKGNSAITDEEMKEWSPELIDVIGRKAREIAAELVSAQTADLAGKVAGLENSVKSVATSNLATRRERFYAYMDRARPDWKAIDDDPLFIAWLDEPDTWSTEGKTRAQTMKFWMDQENFARVNMIFQGYVNEQGITNPPSPPPPANNGNGRTRLEKMAAPGNGRGRTDAIVDTNAPEAPLYARDIARYYRTKQRNPNAYTKAEIDAMDARIAKALATGNVIPEARV